MLQRILIFPILLFLCCSHERDNPYDPGRPGFHPIEPPGLTAFALGPHSIKLEWADINDHEMGYVVRRGTEPGLWDTCFHLPAGTQGIIDSGLGSFCRYYYRLGVFTRLADTVLSPIMTGVRTRAAIPLELPVSSLLPKPRLVGIVRLSTDSVRVSWEPNPGAILGYALRRGKAAHTLQYVATLEDTASGFTDRLTGDTLTYYEVLAFDTASRSGGALDSVSLLLRPLALSTYFSDGGVRILWRTNSLSTDSLLLERRMDSSLEWNAFHRFFRTESTFLDTAVDNFTRYWYRIRPVSGLILGPASNVDTETVKFASAPIPDANTISCLHMDEESGDTLYDAGPRKVPGRLRAASRAKGKFGKGIFSGDSGTAILPGAIRLSDESFFIEFWMRPDPWQALTKGVDSIGLLGSEDTNLSVYYFDGLLHVRVRDTFGQAHEVTDGQTFALNQWTHIAFSRSNGFQRLYVNGARCDIERADFILPLTLQNIILGRTPFIRSNTFRGGFDELSIKRVPDPHFSD